MLCKAMCDKYDLVAITNDIYTKEDQRRLTVAGALPAERIMGAALWHHTLSDPFVSGLRKDYYVDRKRLVRIRGVTRSLQRR
ncbi:hypothetical protein SAMN05192539_1004334 [Paraburkholderia diazotrophica]|uniref:Uncharacterized protein n=1 Tax=Paraburkholderia diazotrophica TaxID=667676 RepID=A0A1H6U8Y6_9BURK|nr:hypothetical protein SAMN05192539_1004334 [Paraburkholderia diazotrophica]